MMGLIHLLLLSAVTARDTVNYEFRLAKYYTSDMVLQSGGAAVWGWGGPGAEVQVEVGGQVARTTVDAKGMWRARVNLAPGGPHNITLTHR